MNFWEKFCVSREGGQAHAPHGARAGGKIVIFCQLVEQRFQFMK